MKSFAISMFLLCLAAQSKGQILLEDFTSMRKNGYGDDLWSALLSEDPDQTYALENGMLKIVGSKQTGCSYQGCGVYAQFMPYPYVPPMGWAHSYIKSGPWNANVNRFRFKFKCTKSVTRIPDGGGGIDIGTYIKSPDNPDPGTQGAHYYHSVDPNVYAGRWMMIELNRVPQHEVADNASINYPEDPQWANPDTGNSRVHYFDGLTRFYFDSTNTPNWSGETCYFDDFVFDTRTGEPDTYVNSITATHSGTAYEVTWNGPKNQNQSYEIRYSTTSMKSAGFNSGTDGGTAQTPNNDYSGVFWKSPNMSESTSGMYVAIRPTGQSAFTEIFIPAMNLGGGSPAAPPCDLNGDTIVNNSDVTMAKNAVLGQAACAADLDGDGKCTIIEVQRVVNASQGSSCRTGP